MTAPDPHAWPETLAPERIEAARFEGFCLGLTGAAVPVTLDGSAETRAFVHGNTEGFGDYLDGLAAEFDDSREPQ